MSPNARDASDCALLCVQVVKKMGAKLQMRVLQQPLVEHWTQRIRALGRDIARINEVRPLACCLAHESAPSSMIFTSLWLQGSWWQ